MFYRAVDDARFGPQGGNRQPARFVIVRDPAKKKALADKAQHAAAEGQAKIAELQAKRKADGMLLELGGIVYSERAGRPVENGETRVAQLVAQLQAHEAEHGPVKVTGAGSEDAESGGTGPEAD